MASNWDRACIKELSERVSVGHVGKTSEYFCDPSDGIPLIRSQNVRPGKLIVDDLKYVTHSFHNKTKKSQLKTGDVLVVRVGQNRGDTCRVPDGIDDLNCANIVFIRPKSINSRFLEFYLRSPMGQHSLLGVSVGSAQEVLNTKSIADLEVPVPTTYEQEKIATILGTLDDNIELNRQMNDTLEAMAQALFKSWFVDFDPVIDNTLAAGNEIPEPLQQRAAARQALGDQRKPLPADIQSLFPDRFVFTDEMGWIPEAWSVVELKTFGDIVCGKTPSKSNPDYFGGEIPFIKIPDMHSAMFVTCPSEYLSELGASSQAKKEIPRGSVCVSCIATVGKVIITTEPSHTNQQINTIIPKQLWATNYLYFSMLDKNKLFHDLASGGSATLNMNTSTFSSIDVLKPADEILKLFNADTAKLTRKIELGMREAETLSKLRDTLLPKLLSGELRLSDAEKRVAEAV